ncbi:hypothetical protein MNBD_CHLOROFLEXI01-4069 [hydrothermal vent metagenome]|uniref:Uncharacterized protein n=1 Tax=hydrothermal vent metagenome TaxID=652676 RepID=A0A3B0VVL6_9ZZZZ
MALGENLREVDFQAFAIFAQKHYDNWYARLTGLLSLVNFW